MSKILTVTGFIFSGPWSLLPSLIMLKQLSFNLWTMARFRMHKALVFRQAYAFAIFESRKMFLNNGVRWPAVAIDRLCLARKPVTITLAALTGLSRSEPTATKCGVIGLWALLLFNKSQCFLEVQCLSKLAFPWHSTGMDLLQIKQNKLYKVFVGTFFSFFFEPLFQNLALLLVFFLFLCRGSHACILTTSFISSNFKCKNLFSCNIWLGMQCCLLWKSEILCVLWNVLISKKHNYLMNENKVFINHALNLLFCS